jgi:hypothetical protein
MRSSVRRRHDEFDLVISATPLRISPARSDGRCGFAQARAGLAVDGGTDTPWYPTARLFRQSRATTGTTSLPAWHLAARLVAIKNRSPSPPERTALSGAALCRSRSASWSQDDDPEIKAQRIRTPPRSNVRNELALLAAARARFAISDQDVGPLKADLKQINEMLWDIEDRIRDCERDKNFGPEFIELARSVYRTNDRRAALKRQINELAGSSIVEENSYRHYS